MVNNELLTLEIRRDIYRPSKKASSDATIPAMRDVTFIAGNEIILYPGFNVESGVAFTARIESCLDAMMEEGPLLKK